MRPNTQTMSEPGHMGALRSSVQGLLPTLIVCAAFFVGCVDPPREISSPPDLGSAPDATGEMPAQEMGEDLDEMDAASVEMGDMPVVDLPGSDPRCEEELPQGSPQRFQAGTGVSGDPYLVCTANQLKLIAVEELERVNAPRRRAGAFYRLGQDIHLDPKSTWTPIPCLRGELDGADHRITNITLTEQDEPSGCFVTSTFERVGGFVNNLWGTVRNITFARVQIGAESNPLPSYLYSATQTPYNQGGIFGNMVSARLEDVNVEGMEAFVTWSFGGLSHDVINSTLERVKLHDIKVRHGHGRVGGLSVYLQNTAPNGVVIDGLEIQASLLQDEAFFGAMPGVAKTPVGLMTAYLHGAATLNAITLGGQLYHERTAAEQDTDVGIVAATSFDQLPSTLTEDEIKALQGGKIKLSNLTIEDVQLTGCLAFTNDSVTEVKEETCRTSGAIFGTFGRAAGQRGPVSSPLEVSVARIQNVTMQSARPGLLFGRIYDDTITLQDIQIQGVTLGAEPSTSEDELQTQCLWSDVVEGDAQALVTISNLCIEQSVCPGKAMASSPDCAPQ